MVSVPLMMLLILRTSAFSVIWLPLMRAHDQQYRIALFHTKVVMILPNPLLTFLLMLVLLHPTHWIIESLLNWQPKTKPQLFCLHLVQTCSYLTIHSTDISYITSPDRFYQWLSLFQKDFNIHLLLIWAYQQ